MECSGAWEGARCVQGPQLALQLKTYGDRRSAPGLQTHIQTCSLWTTDTRQGQQQDPKFLRADPTPSKYLAIFQVNTKRQLNLERFTDANGTQLDYREEKGQRDHLRGQKQLGGPATVASGGADACLGSLATLEKLTRTRQREGVSAWQRPTENSALSSADLRPGPRKRSVTFRLLGTRRLRARRQKQQELAWARREHSWRRALCSGMRNGAGQPSVLPPGSRGGLGATMERAGFRQLSGQSRCQEEEVREGSRSSRPLLEAQRTGVGEGNQSCFSFLSCPLAPGGALLGTHCLGDSSCVYGRPSGLSREVAAESVEYARVQCQSGPGWGGPGLPR